MTTDKNNFTLTSFLEEFAEFLKEYNVIALAVAFILGAASTALIDSFVKGIFMPLLSLLSSADSLQDASFDIGTSTIRYGMFFAELVNFFLLALVVFFVIKKLMKVKKV